VNYSGNAFEEQQLFNEFGKQFSVFPELYLKRFISL